MLLPAKRVRSKNRAAPIAGSATAVRRYAAYEREKARLRAAYDALPPGDPVRLAKRTSNLFRKRERHSSRGLDVGAFNAVLSVDPVARTADVQGMTTYEDLVDATLPHGLVPLVVPQLRTITLGGAVTGLGIESASFRNGLPHESVLEMEVLTGDGDIVVTTPTGEHRALHYGFPNSYGTLGYALRLTIELERINPYVQLRHVRHHSADELFADMGAVCAAGHRDGEQFDFVDGTAFSPDELYLTLGSYVDTAPETSDYTGTDIYYRSIQRLQRDYLSTYDYLWRWDTDWFWCSRAFGVQRPLVRQLVPKRLLRSDTYWRIIALERRFGVANRVDRWRGRPDREPIVQDIEVPISRAAEFHDFFAREIGISPVWLCPLRQRDPRDRWDLYVMDPETTYVNFGFWSSVPLRHGEGDGTYNRKIERVVQELGGRKSLYSTSYYDEAEFWQLYGGSTYDMLKKTYDTDGRLLDLYDKCVRRR